VVAEKIYNLLPLEWPRVIGDLPSTNDVVVGIMEYDGATSTEYFGAVNCTVFNPIVKIVIRHTSYPEGQQWSEEVKELLHRYHDEGDGILSILMVGTPIYLGRNEQKLHEFQVTFNISVKE
jgi:hypothetical protein